MYRNGYNRVSLIHVNCYSRGLCAYLNAFSSNLLMRFVNCICDAKALIYNTEILEWNESDFIRRIPNIPCSSKELEIAILNKKTKRGVGLKADPIFEICGINL